MDVLTQKLRNATEGSHPDLLLQAADEITKLKQRLILQQERITLLEEGLVAVRDDVNKRIHGLL